MKPVAAILLLCTLVTTTLWAGNTGKIAGTVTDKQTGSPLPGVNISIVGTRLGASSSPDGSYFIIAVPPGTYQLKASLIGYQPVVVKEVAVRVDLTTTVSVKLETGSVEMPEIVLVAERSMVRKDVTSTRKIVNRDDVVSAPGVDAVTDVFKLRAGVSVDQIPTRLPVGDGSALQVQDESLKNIHVRGGRGGEILYVVDGMPVTHPLYGGREVLDLNVQDVQQIELLTGAFNAEYGQAQSGVVNITTRSGGQDLEIGAEYRRDLATGISPGQNNEYASLYGSGSMDLGGISDGLGGLQYFISGNLRRADGSLNLHRTREEVDVLNFIPIMGRQDNISNLNVKLGWDLSRALRFTLSHQGSWKDWTAIAPGYKWLFKDYPDNTAEYSRGTQNWNLRSTYVVSPSLIFNLNLGYLQVDYNASLDGHSNPADFWVPTLSSTGGDSIYTTARQPRIDPATSFYDATGIEATWRDDLTRTYTAKAEVLSQIHPEHIVKAGASIQYNDLQYTDIQDGAYKLSNYGEWKYRNRPYADPPPGPFPEFGQNRWVFHTYPFIGDAYIQDKFEKESLIFNVGVRFDWIHLGDQINSQEYKDKWEAATGIPPDWEVFKYSVSPRFGISFPISEVMVAFFSYGHFQQLPELQQYYRDPWSGGLTGNPQMGFEKTVLYEFGFTYQFAEEWAVDIKAYGKDISDQVGTEYLLAASGVPVQLYVNNNYGRTRGMELELTKAYADFISLNASYALQWATGYSSSAYSDYIRQSFNLPQPIRERPLDWDIRNQFMLNLAILCPPGKTMRVFGLELPDNWELSLLTRYSSGLPYTPGTMDPLETRVRENGETMPYTFVTDIKFTKGFRIPYGEVALYINVYNLFNRRNTITVNNWTGEAFKYGDVRGGENEIIRWQDAYAISGPGWYSPPREIQLGLRITMGGM